MPFLTRRTRERPPDDIPRLMANSIPFSRTKNEMSVHVLERPPMEVPVSFAYRKRLRDRKWSKKVEGRWRYKISVPWQYFIVRTNRVGAFTDTFIWFARSKIKDPQEGVIYCPPLPNIYPSGHICNGTIKVDLSAPLHERVSKAFESFWTTPFTEETWPETHTIIPRCWSSPERYKIMYGWLRYTFEYWVLHDKHASNCRFPFRLFQVNNPAMPEWNHNVLESLSDAMDYALEFVTPNRSDRDDE